MRNLTVSLPKTVSAEGQLQKTSEERRQASSPGTGERPGQTSSTVYPGTLRGSASWPRDTTVGGRTFRPSSYRGKGNQTKHPAATFITAQFSPAPAVCRLVKNGTMLRPDDRAL